MSLPDWKDMISGQNCPLCQTRPDIDEYSFKIIELDVSTLYLERDQQYAGYCVLKFTKRHATGLEHLTAEEHASFARDLKTAADAIYRAFTPDHMNYATLGNVIPHLHYHLIPRYKDDGRWGAPVWLTDLKDMPRKALKDADYLFLVDKIKKSIIL